MAHPVWNIDSDLNNITYDTLGISGWRSIKKTEHTNSGVGNQLFVADSINTVSGNTSSGIDLVYMETTTNRLAVNVTHGDNDYLGMYIGLRADSPNSNDLGTEYLPDSSNTASELSYKFIEAPGVYTSGSSTIPYAVLPIGSVGNGTASINGKYGVATVYAICRFSSSNGGHNELYMSAEGAHNSSNNEYFKGSYFTKKGGDLGTWIELPENNGLIHGMKFAFIAFGGTNDDHQIKFSHTFEKGYKYKIELYAHCLGVKEEGVAVRTTIGSPGTQTSIINFSNVTDINGYKVCYQGGGDDANNQSKYILDFSNYATNQTLYFYFRTISIDQSNTNPSNPYINYIHYDLNVYRYAYVKITRYVNAYINAAAGVKVVTQIEPYTHIINTYDDPGTDENPTIAPKVISPSSLASVGLFRFTGEGVYTSIISNNLSTYLKVLNSDGTYTGNKIGGFDGDGRIGTTDANVSWYGQWYNDISYSPYNSAVSVWCTTSAKVALSTDVTRPVSVANYNAKCGSEGEISVSYPTNTSFSFDTSPSIGGYPNDYPTKNIWVNQGVPAGTYDLGSVTLKSPSGPNYKSVTRTYNLPSINVSAVTADYDTVTQPSVSQISDIPANGVSLNSGNLSSYFSGYNSAQTITYTNGKTGSGSITYSYGGSISLSSLGTTYKPNRETVNISSNAIYVKAMGGGSKSSTSYISSVTYASNDVSLFVYPVDSTLLSVSVISMSVDDYFDMCILARYTSGAERDLVGDGPESGVSYSIMTPSFLVVGSI